MFAAFLVALCDWAERSCVPARACCTSPAGDMVHTAGCAGSAGQHAPCIHPLCAQMTFLTWKRGVLVLQCKSVRMSRHPFQSQTSQAGQFAASEPSRYR